MLKSKGTEAEQPATKFEHDNDPHFIAFCDGLYEMFIAMQEHESQKLARGEKPSEEKP